MATINTRYGRLQVDFRYKNQRCREQTRFEDTPANRKRLQKIVERMKAEIVLGTFVYRNYFPKSSKVAFFEELDAKVMAAQLSPYGNGDDIPTFGQFTELWLLSCGYRRRKSNGVKAIY